VLGVVHRDIPLTAEIYARTRPNLMDLMIGLGGGAAGAYAITSPRLSVAFVRVAIATALVPRPSSMHRRTMETDCSWLKRSFRQVYRHSVSGRNDVCQPSGCFNLLTSFFARYTDRPTTSSAAPNFARHWPDRERPFVTGSGKFSSDRAVREHCDEVWNVSAVPVPPDGGVVSPSSGPT
jgi:hypothetical protein